jgi:hypothetical protein
VKDLYNGDSKLLEEEIKDDIRRWKDIPCSWIGRINIMKLVLQQKIIYMFNAISVKITMTFFRGRKINPKVHMEAQKNKNSQSNPEQKNTLKVL